MARDLHLEHLEANDVGCQSSEALSTTASDANEEHVTSGLTDDSDNAAHCQWAHNEGGQVKRPELQHVCSHVVIHNTLNLTMIDGILEEDQVHCNHSRFIVVVVEGVLHELLQLLEAKDVLVHGLGLHEVTKDGQLLGAEVVEGKVKNGAQLLCDQGGECLVVPLPHKSVRKDTVALMHPQTGHCTLGVVVVLVGPQQTLKHLGWEGVG